MYVWNPEVILTHTHIHIHAHSAFLHMHTHTHTHTHAHTHTLYRWTLGAIIGQEWMEALWYEAVRMKQGREVCTYICIDMHTYPSAGDHTQRATCMYTLIHTNISPFGWRESCRLCTHIHTYICIHTHTFQLETMHRELRPCIYTHTHKHMHAHTHTFQLEISTHIHIHVHIHTYASAGDHAQRAAAKLATARTARTGRHR